MHSPVFLDASDHAREGGECTADLVVVGVEAQAVKDLEHLPTQVNAEGKEVHTLISFSELPLHLEPTEDADILKKVVLHSVATALARRVLPVPGGPYKRMPCNIMV